MTARSQDGGTHDGGTWALVPVKKSADAKSRLAPLLSAAHRIALQRAMLTDVLVALGRSRLLRGVMVVTADAAVAAFAHDRGCVVANEPAGGELNAALRAGLAALRQKGASRALIVPADIPLIDAADIDHIVALGERLPMSFVVPSFDLTGTNGFLLHVDNPPDLAFGRDSFRKHVYPGRGRLAMQVSSPSLAIDVDTPADLSVVAEKIRKEPSRDVASSTAAWLQAQLELNEECRP